MTRIASPLARLRRFTRARSGATAIEFAIIGIPLFMLVFGLLELGLVLLVSATLDTAIDFASRDIRTGNFQTSGKITAKDFEERVCRNMTWLASGCTSRLSVEAETFATFTAAGASTPQAPDEFEDDSPRCWSVGAPGDIVLVRAYYVWPLFTPLLDASLQNRGDGTRLIGSARAFRNEPYSNDGPVGAKC
ncbi:MAG: TadE/TadG family type IV pilus assembly protein [Phenylobacterium sp.]|jgi:Flp pilus assembly protein TadG|uniref:TadE/TadG family type IV pilus assembly protein n=1 Tax=Phenylobacterium sp. TaxID=1871053 RepID=UPI00391D375A